MLRLVSAACKGYGVGEEIASCVQVWVSPWQVAHVLSIIHTLQGDLAPAWQPAAARSRSLQRRGSRLTYMSSSHLHFACTLDVPLLSAIVMVPIPLPLSLQMSHVCCQYLKN